MKRRVAAVILGMLVCVSAAGVRAEDFGGSPQTGGQEVSAAAKGNTAREDGGISEIADRIVDHVETEARERLELKEETKKAEDARTVQRRAEEGRRKASESRREAKEEAARQEEAKRVAHRQEIVNFALQFEGNPYVYGGTSLTNGTDCSGFVMSVFKEFGYDLPRTSGAQYQASVKKDIKDIEKVDLVFYGYGASRQVALYIGQGKIIHASTSATGSKISDNKYETVYGIGTYLK